MLMYGSMGGDAKWKTLKEQAKSEASKQEAKAEGVVDQAKDKFQQAKEEVQKKVS